MLIETRFTWHKLNVTSRLLCFEDSLLVCIKVELCILLMANIFEKV